MGVVSGPAVADVPPGGSFLDDDGSVHEGAIEAIAAVGVTVGCDVLGERFCPDRAVTRAEMATLLVRALGVERREPVRFTDAVGVHRGSIGAAEVEGWFKGCNPPANDLFCPDDVLTRGQAAAVLVRAFGLPAGDGDFSDTSGSVFVGDIAALAAAGVTKGCDPPVNTRFCPGRAVTRGEMATFLTRLLGLTPQTPAPAFQGRIVLDLWNGLVGFGGIATMEGTRDPRTLIADTVGHPLLSPDGMSIAYVDMRRECPPVTSGWWDCYTRIFTTPFDGGSEAQMTPNAITPGSPTWLPGGSSIGFSEIMQSDVDEWTGEWYLSTVATGEPLLVERIAGPYALEPELMGWSWSPDHLAIVDQRPGGSTIVVLNRDGDEVVEIVASGSDLTSPEWSPDGTQLAYVVRSAEDELVISAADGTDTKTVCVAQNMGVPRWSSDGTLLAFAAGDGEESLLGICLADGGGSRVLTEAPDLWSVTWNPDGSSIGFVSRFRAWAVSAAGGEPWPLTPSDTLVASIDWGAGP